ncbi:MAG: hypothetical protein CSA15_03235 [Candidatus Delongbacteria bacterium]|nr:MAG: hypothetical protein CSA15_03235 [Candidatus Delongbacteria bacterium]
MKLDSDITIKNSLGNINITKQPRILELGYGKGWLTKILRLAYPEAYIITYDKFKKKITKKIFDIVDEFRPIDINSKLFEKEQYSYDLVTLGSIVSNPSFHFGFLTKEIYAEVIKSMNFYLKKDGLFFIIFNSYYYENEREKNYLDRDKFLSFEAPNKDLSNPMFKYDGIIDVTKEIFEEIGNFELQIDRVKNNDKPSKNLKGCEEMLKLQKDMKISNYYDNPVLLAKARDIDERLKSQGWEYGYFYIIKVFKR